MIKDYIKSKVIELLIEHFEWIEIDEVDLYANNTSFRELQISLDEILEFSSVIEVEFKLDMIDLNCVRSWETIDDIVEFIEDVAEFDLIIEDPDEDKRYDQTKDESVGG